MPSCRKCLAHIKASRELRRFSMFVPHLSVVFRLVGAAVAFVLLFTLIQRSSPLAVGLSVLAGATPAVGVAATYRWCRDKYDQKCVPSNAGAANWRTNWSRCCVAIAPKKGNEQPSTAVGMAASSRCTSQAGSSLILLK